jgi:hypothetical protein
LLIVAGFLVYLAKSTVEKHGWVPTALRNQRKAA